MKVNRLWGQRLEKETSKIVLAFTSGRDVKATQPYDQRLIPYDLWGSKAHVIMLWKQGVVAKKEARAVLKGLNELENTYQRGKFKIDPAKEDVHSSVESYLIERCGMESAGKLHTGRSRNDQVVVDMRLYLRAEMLTYSTLLLNFIDTLVEVAEVHVDTVMPGYTHHQPAMIGSFGHLLFSYATSLKRDSERFANWHHMFNINPLGGAAGYGTRVPLDRHLTAQLLGFDGVEENSLDPSHNRGEAELELCYAISVMMNHLSNLAHTLIVLSTPEFGMIQLDDAFCTGSSVMPQKKNPDPLEVVKGKAAYTHGMLMSLLSSGRSLFTGYNRDSQWTKYPIMDVIDECKPSLIVLKEIITTITFHGETARTRCEKNFIAATDVVEWLVKSYQLPFRHAKVVVERAVKYSERKGNEKITFAALQKALKEMRIRIKIDETDLVQSQNPQRVLAERTSAGGPSPVAMRKAMRRFSKASQMRRKWLNQKITGEENAHAEAGKMAHSLT